VSRELYAELNAAFLAHLEASGEPPASIDQSHAGSSKQARAVADGLEADVVSMNQQTDMDFLVSQGLVSGSWKSRLPDGASPYFSTIVFLVRAGNPRNVRGWEDLLQPEMQVIIPNPKTSGNGRYAYLAAWACAAEKGRDPAAFLKELFAKVPILESGGRSATNAFVQKGIGDVLITFESEVSQIRKAFDASAFEVVYPEASILAEFPVSVVDRVVERRGTREFAERYLRFLWTPEAQRIIASHALRPQDGELRREAAFPDIRLISVEQAFGGWEAAQKTHFDSGGTFDAIYAGRR
jgi:sulfate transport system substrate-binding protein